MIQLPNNIITVDWISNLIDEIRDTNTITNIVNEGGGVYKIETPETLNLTNNDYVVIGTDRYKISVLLADSFKVTGDEPIGASWKAEAPYFYYGTPIENASVRDTESNEYKYPFVALFEPIVEYNVDFQRGNGNLVLKESDIWLVFLTAYPNDDWTNEQHYTNAIKPMNDIMIRFVEKLHEKVGSEIQSLSNFVQINKSKWGLWLKDSGSDRKLFNENLSGVEVKNLRIKFLKRYTNCLNN